MSKKYQYRELLQSLTTRETEDSKKTITLRIKLDSYSPTYGNYYKWREKIDSSAFDESLAEVANGTRTIYAFADHQMDTRSIIGSSANPETTIEKVDGEIRMTFPVDETDEVAMKIYRQIQDGTITGNSFIFKMEDYEHIDREADSSEWDYEVNVKRGELISIDPVVFPFYPQNKMEARDANTSGFDEIHKKHKQQKEEDIMKEYLLRNLVNAYKKNKIEFKQTELEAKSDVELFELLETQKRAEFEALIEERMSKEEVKIAKANFEATMTEMRNTLEAQNQEELNTLRAEVLKLSEAKDTEKMSFEDSVKRFVAGNYWTRSKEDSVKMGKNFVAKNKEAIATMSDFERGLLGVNTRDFTGADDDNASLIIPTFTDKNLISDNAIVIPEIQGGMRIAIIGESEVKVPVQLDSQGTASEKQISEDATKVSFNVIDLLLKPTKYNDYIQYNPRMQTHVDAVPSQTVGVVNTHLRAWRSNFANSLLTHVAATFASVSKAYTGGATLESVVDATTAGTLSLGDFDNMIDGLVAEYGDGIKSNGVFYMTPATWTAVKALARENKNDVTVEVDVRGKRIAGVPVVTSGYFNQELPESGETKYPVVFYNRSSIRTYGGNTVIKDSNQQEFLSDQNVRKAATWGEAKLADPHYTTRVLKIVAA